MIEAPVTSAPTDADRPRRVRTTAPSASSVGSRRPFTAHDGTGTATASGRTATPDAIRALTRLTELVEVPAEVGDDQFVTALETVCDIIPGARWATLCSGGGSTAMRTLHATHRRARAADDLQFQLQEGPIVDVLSRRRPLMADAMATDPRWPRLVERLQAQTPVGAILSVPVQLPRQLDGALTLYGGSDHGFTDEATSVTVAVAGTVLAGLGQRERAAALHRALMSNRRIGVAIGILMSTHRWTEQHAFQVLMDTAEATTRTIADLAGEVTRVGALPGVS